MKKVYKILLTYVLLIIIPITFIGIDIREHKCNTTGNRIVSFYIPIKCHDEQTKEHASNPINCEDDCCKIHSEQKDFSHKNNVKQTKCCEDRTYLVKVQSSVVFEKIKKQIAVPVNTLSKIFDDISYHYNKIENSISKYTDNYDPPIKRIIQFIVKTYFQNYSSESPTPLS
ncbi:MAG TPA: hypothetical protein PK762_10365 [Candidatus Kapabacteria bacterium]|nr:hypothetical protein [Candidatus Kapabacteria bacterium]